MRCPAFGTLCVLLLVGLVPSAAKAFGGDRRVYDSLVALVRGGDTTIDLRQLRLAFSELPEFDPYSINGRVKEMAEAARDGAWELAAQIADSILETCYVSLPAHRTLALACSELGRTECASFHTGILARLVRSIVRIGNGSSPETAWSVISVEEEHALIEAAGLEFQGQSLLQNMGHFYDRVEVNDPFTNTDRLIYFNVDIPTERMQAQLGR